MRFARVTRPTSCPLLMIGTRLIEFFSSSDAISGRGVSGVAVITLRVMMSATLRLWARTYSAASVSFPVKSSSQEERLRSVPASERRSRSPSVTMPTRFPLSSTTGTPLIRRLTKTCATSFTDESGVTVITGDIITSRALMTCLLWPSDQPRCRGAVFDLDQPKRVRIPDLLVFAGRRAPAVRRMSEHARRRPLVRIELSRRLYRCSPPATAYRLFCERVDIGRNILYLAACQRDIHPRMRVEQ